MAEVQFTPHALERVLGRMSPVVTYAEVQAAVAASPVANCHRRLIVKRLARPAKIADAETYSGFVQGDVVYAHVSPVNGGWMVDTVCLTTEDFLNRNR